jgi:hypothetical protein
MERKVKQRRIAYLRPKHYGTWSWVVVSSFLVVMGLIVTRSQAAGEGAGQSSTQSLLPWLIAVAVLGLVGFLIRHYVLGRED